MKWKREFEEHRTRLKGGNLIIRHLQRADGYPNLDQERKGISSWFRVEYWGIYHRGIEVVLGVESVRLLENEWIICHHEDQGHINAIIIGRIPFHVIAEMDWSGDEYYSFPHAYCEFPRKQHGQPYEEVVICEHHSGHPNDFLTELDNYKSVVARSKHLGTRA